MALLLRRFVSARLEEEAREHAQEAASRPPARDRAGRGAPAGEHVSPRPRPGATSPPTSAATGRCSGRRSRLGFLLAGFIGLLGDDFFNVLFITDAPPLLRTLENVLVGPLIAILSFVCSVGNVPLAAVLWSGGIGFAGVVAFIFADLIVLPIVLAYRKYYGTAFALRITALMFVTIVIAALIVDGLFGARRPDPDRAPPQPRRHLRLDRGSTTSSSSTCSARRSSSPSSGSRGDVTAPATASITPCPT